ncbi:MAG: hypothetical protein R3E01_01605 [Pirellulaceae bacterium]
MFEDFDGGGTTPYSIANSVGAAPSLVAGGPTGSFLQLQNGTANANNAVAFNEDPTVTGPRPHGKILSADFRLTVNGASGETAALGFGYAAIGPWGTSGPRNPGFEDPAHDWNAPAYQGAVMVSIDVSPGSDVVSLSGFGSQLASVDVQPMLNLDDGKFHRGVLTVTPDPSDATKAMFDLDIIEDVHGAAISHSILAGLPANINLSGLPGNRVISGATSTNLEFTADLDNVGVRIIPEPGGLALALMALVGLCRMGRRRV